MILFLSIRIFLFFFDRQIIKMPHLRWYFYNIVACVSFYSHRVLHPSLSLFLSLILTCSKLFHLRNVEWGDFERMSVLREREQFIRRNYFLVCIEMEKKKRISSCAFFFFFCVENEYWILHCTVFTWLPKLVLESKISSKFSLTHTHHTFWIIKEEETSVHFHIK